MLVDKDAVIAAIEGLPVYVSCDPRHVTKDEVIAAIRALPDSPIQHCPNCEALAAENERLRIAAKRLHDDLLERAEWCPDAGKVVCAGNTAWSSFCEALQETKP